MQFHSNRLAVLGLMAAASGMGLAQGVAVLPSPPRVSGYRMGRRSRPQPDTGGYPGAKLAKQARKGTLTISRLR